MMYCAAFGCKHDSARYRVVFFLIPLEKQTVVNGFTIEGGLVGRPSDMLDFVWPILKSRVLKLIYFHQLMG